MDNLYTVISYVNYELKVLVYNAFIRETDSRIIEKRPLLIYEEVITKKDLKDLKTDAERESVAKKLQKYINNAKKITKQDPNKKMNVYVVFDPVSTYNLDKSYTFDFGQEHIVTQADLTKAMNLAMYDETPHEGYKIVNFIPHETKVNDVKIVKNALGLEVDTLNISGEILLADASSYYSITSILSYIDVDVVGLFVGENLIKNMYPIDNNSGLIEIGTRSINFTFNIDHSIKQTTLSVGFEKILNDFYSQLLDTYSPEESEKAVRFIMDYFPLKEYRSNLYVFSEVALNDIIKKFSELVVAYFKHIFNQLAGQGIELEEYVLLLHDYPQNEFVSLLNNNLSINLKNPQEFKNNVAIANIKSYYLIDLILSDKTQTIIRGEHG